MKPFEFFTAEDIERCAEDMFTRFCQDHGGGSPTWGDIQLWEKDEWRFFAKYGLERAQAIFNERGKRVVSCTEVNDQMHERVWSEDTSYPNDTHEALLLAERPIDPCATCKGCPDCKGIVNPGALE